MANSADIQTTPVEADKDVRAYQVVGNTLLERIRAGEFRAIGKLPPERELAEIYGVGRAVIRDALVMLEVKGLIQSRQGSGIYITRRAYEIDPEGSADAAPSQPWDSLPPAGPYELLQARQWLESHMARLAATNATDDDIVAIEQAYEDHRTANFGEPKDNFDMVFHMTIARATQNPELVGLVNQLWFRRENNPLWKSFQARMADIQPRDRLTNDHDKIVEAMRRRDGDAAYVAMWQHIENMKTFLFSTGDMMPDDGEPRSPSRRRLKQSA
jgi:GntR family uxuAB operon transcriptional repressor